MLGLESGEYEGYEGYEGFWVESERRLPLLQDFRLLLGFQGVVVRRGHQRGNGGVHPPGFKDLTRRVREGSDRGQSCSPKRGWELGGQWRGQQ